MQQGYTGSQKAEDVYDSLKWQMFIYVFVAAGVLYSWNFYPLVAVLLALCTTLIPVDQRDAENKITQVAGYFGVLEGWQVSISNRLVLIQRFCLALFSLLCMRVVVDLIAFASLYFNDKEGYEAGVGLATRDLLCLILEGVCGFIGYTYVTGQPKVLFSKLIELQKNKILVVLTAVSVLTSIFATNKALKLLPIFCVCGIAFSAPPTAGADGGKRVVHVEAAATLV